MDFNTSNSFGSRRSYPNLHHISLAPLTPRFPIDDDPEPTDYFSPRDNTTSITPTRTSYLTSVSVPSTPPILSHSRSGSRTRHARSKSSTRAAPLSDTNLQSQNVSLPLHHNHHQAPGHKKRPSASYTRRQYSEGPNTDAEWMLRAGIALASSTREEKGQSWLSKRESSTNLVSEVPDSLTHHRHHTRTKSGASASRKSRSGTSTPAAYSRRSSRSRGGSRRGSRAGLTMTTMPPLSTSADAAGGKAPSPGTGAITPEVRGRGALVPDFVDERIRAEMAELQRSRAMSDGDEEEYWDEEANDSEYDYFSDETPDEIDEADLQRLTRERGFGLGSWIDRLVEWTLFGVDDLPPAVSSTAAAAATRIGTAATSTTVTFEEPVHSRDERESAQDNLSLGSDDEAETLSHTDGESIAGVEKPGAQGGWEDAGWLFRVMKRALI